MNDFVQMYRRRERQRALLHAWFLVAVFFIALGLVGSLEQEPDQVQNIRQAQVGQ